MRPRFLVLYQKIQEILVDFSLALYIIEEKGKLII